jgi:NDP-sugar pyrophosphorylase family protein
MFTGVHVLEAEFLRSVPQGSCDIVRTAYTDLIARQGPVYAHVQREGAFFAENSTAERYLNANLALLGCGVPFPWPTVGVDASATIQARAEVGPSVRVGSGARVEAGARIRNSVIGHDAVVAAGVELVDSVVWPGAIATQRANGAILTPRQRVQVRQDPRELAGS